MFTTDGVGREFDVTQDTTVWRYMDFPRFVSLLEDQNLHFARADKMVDRWEGALEAPEQTNPANDAVASSVLDTSPREIFHRVKTSIYLNCWNASEHESAALWSVYQTDGRGVAVRTTWARLVGSITSRWPIHGGAVRYVDYRATRISGHPLLETYLHKRQSFAHEHEVRLILWSYQGGGPRELTTPDADGVSYAVGDDPLFYKVDLDLDALEPTVFVAPDASTWVAQLAEKIVRRYGRDWTVTQSDLYSDPVW
jgi:hypothetical protein